MREILYIRLPSGVPADDLESTVVDFGMAEPDRPNRALGQYAPLGAVLDRVDGRRVVLLVPGADVRLTSVTVPARQPSKVLQAAPYLLEDQLAEDVDTLHFALGPRQADGSNPVAVVTQALMDRWLAPLRQRGLRPEAVYPETLALPLEPGDTRWSALCETRQAVVRTGAYTGFCCDPDDLAIYLQIADPERSRALRTLSITNSGIDYSRIDWPLELLPGYGSALEALVQHIVPAQSINLLQGAYSQRQDYDRVWKPWRAAAILAGVCGLLWLVNYSVDSWKLSREIAAQEAANEARFHEMFPSEVRIIDMQAQLDQQLRALKGNTGRGGVFVLMEILTQALGANQGLTLQSLQFRDGALFLGLRATDLQVVERLREWFASQRSAALEVQSADAGANGVQVRLKLSPA